jgi:hypothetical protein
MRYPLSKTFVGGALDMKPFVVSLAMVVLVSSGCARSESTSTAGTGTVADTSATQAGDTASSGATATTAEARRNPCSWITEAEAAEALGQPSRYRSNTDDGSSNCIIDHVDDSKTGAISVDFKVVEDEYAWQYESTRKDAQKLEGLGDEAVWSGSESSGTVAVKKGNQVLIAFISLMGQDASLKDKGIAFARKIVEKM